MHARIGHCRFYGLLSGWLRVCIGHCRFYGLLSGWLRRPVLTGSAPPLPLFLAPSLSPSFLFPPWGWLAGPVLTVAAAPRLGPLAGCFLALPPSHGPPRVLGRCGQREVNRPWRNRVALAVVACHYSLPGSREGRRGRRLRSVPVLVAPRRPRRHATIHSLTHSFTHSLT